MSKTVGSASVRCNQIALAAVGIISLPFGTRRSEVHARSLSGTFVRTATDDQTISARLAAVAISVHVGRAVHIIRAFVADFGFAPQKRQYDNPNGSRSFHRHGPYHSFWGEWYFIQRSKET
jgi:hypothetical protein